jgi:hypothetical protein
MFYQWAPSSKKRNSSTDPDTHAAGQGITSFMEHKIEWSAEFESLSVVFMKVTIFCDLAPYSPYMNQRA